MCRKNPTQQSLRIPLLLSGRTQLLQENEGGDERTTLPPTASDWPEGLLTGNTSHDNHAEEGFREALTQS